jgi:hypothetical protein
VKFFSQIGQDRFLLENFFRGKRSGVFVEIAACEGEKFSNTLFYERTMGWTGLCVEPLPSAFAKLKATRSAACENVCVADFEGEADFLEADNVRCRVPVTTLSALLAKHRLTHVDYCSINTQGSEFAILSVVDFDRFDISLLTVRDNRGDERLPKLMAAKGYEVFARLRQDVVFRRRDVNPLARTTVFCAVWHMDPKRFELLGGHAANLGRQTVPLECIYVFDGGETPPPWLKARTVSMRDPLTIYQAWNIALSLVATPLAMNLNLDDRLAPDAVELLEREVQRTGAIMVGGDWKVCYSQAETDAVESCYPAQRLPFVPDWPPRPGTRTRLGSGTRERSGTYGPATIWRMDAHIGAPRYPWRLSEGTPIRAAGDLAWWFLLSQKPNVRMVSLPIVIGNYHSHPQDQAEFRTRGEEALFAEPGVAFL